MGLTSRHSSRFTPIDFIEDDTGVAARVQALIADLEPDRAQMLEALHRIQHELGYVPREAVPFLAAKFKTTPALVWGTITFYSEIRTEPPPRVEVQWCSGPACLLKGSRNIRLALEAELGCRMNESTPDGALGLRLVQCDGTCHLAPLVRVGGRYIGPLTVASAIELARRLKREARGG
ncbi:MAG: NAD(P)H-dependent oxidoreductase subunit E [Dehalococcoidia bacterium]|jgi:NADH:ubiquinone oxidoreductase subunit E|nr:NAD(P)H-dependent oxidoreductase subunit E [Dehalococcoidia bacterium]MDW8008786.1 NAD(P)H-dependent oxidoreductase subunit E [Chloroflexota bacterium]